jgi:hypothetical protein
MRNNKHLSEDTVSKNTNKWLFTFTCKKSSHKTENNRGFQSQFLRVDIKLLAVQIEY